MGYCFKRLFEQLLKEIDVKNIGLFPGKFKPVHKGHFKTAEIASRENDITVIFISSKPHENFNAEQSLKIWDIYSKYIPNIIPFIVTPTPVLACYDFANIINNGEYKSDKNTQPASNIQDLISSSKVIESYINVGNSVNLNLYSSAEDQQRFKNIKKEPYIGRSVLSVTLKPVARITSATKFREALINNKSIDNFLPTSLSEEDKKTILSILK